MKNFSSNGRSNERFAGLMEEKIRFSSGYLLFEIWKSGVKRKKRKGRRREGRNGASRNGRKHTRGLRWVFRGILCSVRSCWTHVVAAILPTLAGWLSKVKRLKTSELPNEIYPANKILHQF